MGWKFYQSAPAAYFDIRLKKGKSPMCVLFYVFGDYSLTI